MRIQLQLAAGATLAKMGLRQFAIPPPRGVAIQARVNLETMNADGTARPTGRHAVAVRARIGAWHSRRWFRLCRLSHQQQIRFAPGQNNRAHRRRRSRRGGTQGRAGAVGISHRRRFDQHFLPARAAANARVRRGLSSYAIHRGTRGKLVRAGRRALAGRETQTPGRRQARKRRSARGPGARQEQRRVAAPSAAPPEHAADIAGPEGTIGIPAPLQGTIISIAVAVGDTRARGRSAVDHGVHENGTCHRRADQRGDSRHQCIAG